MLLCENLDKFLPSNKPHYKLIEFVKDRPGHDKRYSIDSTFLRNSLKWEPKYTVYEGLEITVKWYLENLDCFK